MPSSYKTQALKSLTQPLELLRYRHAYYLAHRAQYIARAKALYRKHRKQILRAKALRARPRSPQDRLCMGMGERPHLFGVFAYSQGSSYRHNGQEVSTGYTL